jgi:phosphoribosylaminoimidazole carboxylase (NCAIR synthetase)
MEWFTRHDGSLAVNEVGARPPGVNIMPMMGLAHGIDFVAAWVRLMALDTFEPPTRVRAAGSAFLRGQGAGRRVAAVHGVQKVMEEVGRHVAIANLPEIGQARAEGYEGEGNIVVAADTTAEVMHALGRIIRTIRITYA